MLSVWWNSEGMVHFEMIPNGRSITAATIVNNWTEFENLCVSVILHWLTVTR
jgi:hypothetical protein